MNLIFSGEDLDFEVAKMSFATDCLERLEFKALLKITKF